MRVSINQKACQGDCICEVICPQMFVLDETGIAWVAPDGVVVQPGGPSAFGAVPAEFEDDVRDAADQCPTGCMTLSEDD